MGILNGEWEDRLQHWIRTLKADMYEVLGAIEWKVNRTTTAEPGYTWGKAYEYCTFQGEITIPERASGQRIVLDLQPGGEACVYVNGEEFGTYRADWISEKHHYLVDNYITGEAKTGERFSIRMEVYAGHDFPNCEDGYCATGPVLPGQYEAGPEDGRRRVLGSSTYGIWNEDAYQLYLDVETLLQLTHLLEETSLRSAKIAASLKHFTYIVDFEQETDKRQRCYREARQMLRPVLAAVNGTTAPLFWAVGNAHLDLAWLWPIEETIRKAERTFAAQLRLLEEYPEYYFIQSQPALYEMCAQAHPKLFERVKEAIKGGRWIADGAMWVEPDTNMTSGESLIRQLIHGKRYYKEVLGVESKVLWLPDSFGYTGALPQILLGCGVNYLVTQKIFWSCNDGETFPYHYFTWEGIDGSKVVSFLPTSYTYRTDPSEVSQAWKGRSQKEDLEAFLLPFGYGDGGGGPTRDHIEYVRRQTNLEGSVAMKMGTPEAFFELLNEAGGPVNTYVGELYFSSHRGTYTSQAMTKKNNRKAEIGLREMELWSSLALVKGRSYQQDQADRLWKTVLFHQFHDILPGSSIERVYNEAAKAYYDVFCRLQKMTQDALQHLTQQGMGITLWNSLSFKRNVLIELPLRYHNGAVLHDGTGIPVQRTADAVKALVEVPACGAVSLFPGTASEAVTPVSVWQEQGVFYMENSQVRAIIDQQGRVISWIRKDSGREFAAGPMNQFRMFKDVPRHFDAWDIDANYRAQEVEGIRDVQINITATGLEGVLQIKGKIGVSEIIQNIRLVSEGERLEFETTVDWQELHRLLKVSFPVAVYAQNARNEMQFGFVERPVHRSRRYDQDRFEVCNHRYTALCDASHGAALLNDCKYGISMEQNTLELTLLKAAASPQMRADNGLHQFTYALFSWEGSFIESGVVRQGYELNIPVLKSEGIVDTFSMVDIDQANIILDTVKPAEDGSGDLILRFYEAGRAAVTTRIRLSLPAAAYYRCNMLEQIQGEIPAADNEIVLSFHGFEIKTVRIRLV